jgi:hypothetical protein
LIYQALANGRFIPGFDKSNPYSPYSPNSTYSPIFTADLGTKKNGDMCENSRISPFFSALKQQPII